MLSDYRNKLNKIDNEIIKLLSKRNEVVLKIKEEKTLTKTPIYDIKQEKNKLKNIIKNLPKNLNKDFIQDLYNQIFAQSRKIQQEQQIAFLGPSGSFTQEMTNKIFPYDKKVECKNIEQVFKLVHNEQVNYAVVPIENSLNGLVSETIECLSKYEVKINEENLKKISFCLATKEKNKEDIEKIYSKDIALLQCSKYINTLSLNEENIIKVASTTSNIDILKNKEAIICPIEIAIKKGLNIIDKNIQNSDDNKTRFFTISKNEQDSNKPHKTTLIVQLENETGALFKLLKRFKKYNVNLIKIKSHIHNSNTKFFIEFDGHNQDTKIQQILKKIKSKTLFVSSYQKTIQDV